MPSATPGRSSATDNPTTNVRRSNHCFRGRLGAFGGEWAMSEGKVAVITAGGRGIGAAIARELHAEGYRLALMSPSGSAKVLADELGGLGVTGVESMSHPPWSRHDARRWSGWPDGAGRPEAPRRRGARGASMRSSTTPRHPPKGELLDIPDEDWHRGVDMMLLQVVRMARLVSPPWLALGGGAIVNITTFAAFGSSRRPPACRRINLPRRSLRQLEGLLQAVRSGRWCSIDAICKRLPPAARPHLGKVAPASELTTEVRADLPI